MALLDALPDAKVLAVQFLHPDQHRAAALLQAPLA